MKELKVMAMPYVSEGTYKPEWASSKAKNAAKLKVLLPKASVDFTYSGFGVSVPVFKVQVDAKTEFYFVHAESEGLDLIQYGVRVIHYHLTGQLSVPVCGQVSVYRNKSYAPSRGMPAWIFKKVLYPKYHRILSDSTQSADGKGFWETRIMEALQSGKKVFALEMDEEVVLGVTPIATPIEMDEFYSTGEDYRGFYYRFLIEGK